LIPPLGGIIMADFWIVNRGRYPRLQAVAMPRVNWAGVITYGLAVLISVAAPGVPPVNGIPSGLILYPLLMHGLARLGHAQGFRIR
jgi:cytosine permease